MGQGRHGTVDRASSRVELSRHAAIVTAVTTERIAASAGRPAPGTMGGNPMRTTAPAIRLALLSALAFVASPAYAEVDPFPTAAATLTGVSFGATSISFFFDTGDQISEVVTTDDALVSRAIFDLVIPANNSQVQIDFDVFVNDIPIGTLSVPAMQTGPIHQEYDFDPISGPDYTVRLTETTQVPGGQGSLTIGYAAADAGTLELVRRRRPATRAAR